jgi:hypothetical protein
VLPLPVSRMLLKDGRPGLVVPIDDSEQPSVTLADDPLYRAPPVGRSSDGRTATEHDALLYGR